MLMTLLNSLRTVLTTQANTFGVIQLFTYLDHTLWLSTTIELPCLCNDDYDTLLSRLTYMV